jgi:entericidin B
MLRVRHRTDDAARKEDCAQSGVSADDYEETLMAKKLLALLTALALIGPVATMTGCNTVAGAGKDIERGGEKIEGGARDVQRKM